MKYLIDVNVTWNTGISNHYRETLEADTIPELKTVFTDYIARKAYQNQANSFTGTVKVIKYEEKDLGEDPFTGTLNLTEVVDVDFS